MKDRAELYRSGPDYISVLELVSADAFNSMLRMNVTAFISKNAVSMISNKSEYLNRLEKHGSSHWLAISATAR